MPCDTFFLMGHSELSYGHIVHKVMVTEPVMSCNLAFDGSLVKVMSNKVKF